MQKKFKALNMKLLVFLNSAVNIGSCTGVPNSTCQNQNDTFGEFCDVDEKSRSLVEVIADDNGVVRAKPVINTDIVCTEKSKAT